MAYPDRSRAGHSYNPAEGKQKMVYLVFAALVVFWALLIISMAGR